ncbi:MAG: hybrid sensor histidine kinase/response regulator [Herminiimonas sp.]|uniref:hybrid sensor histidine kinase/response regulator n=1 Tax=Herminiimonas sp. TaxID=1926289 RepID=UPI00272689FC|nr:hybrid sensor histidine kinase/response regulator [Herminiimonas sp.]MDO9422482.1 hybrid sensor histidine kinase/response regulator [Herminiimonas sp.]
MLALIMTDGTQAKIINVASTGGSDDALPSQEADQFRQTIADLLLRVDYEAEQLRNKTADLLTRVDELDAVTQSKYLLEALVLQLREANQHLVLATFGAQDLQAKAESANLRQEEFLSMLAHELRNPLAPIAMAADLLGKISEAHPMLPKLYGIISRQVGHMAHLVDDLLDASRVTTGNITLQRRSLELSEIIDSAVETSQPFIDKRNQKLSIRLPVQPVIVNGDLVRLSQAFTNLLINATKFTAVEESIDISVEALADTFKVTIKDNGVGIAPDIQPFIFDLFTQGPHSLDRSQGGLGIGLSLVRTVVTMHGGTISVYSEGLGFGSEFIVELPISTELITGDNNDPISIDPVYGRRILVIEDNLSSHEILSELLAIQGHVVTSAFDGTSGLSMAQENIYDIIVCDIGLPGIDGYEVIKQLRLNKLKAMPLCIAISGYSQQKNRTNAERASFDHYLVKPVAIATLANLISPKFIQ